MKLPDEINKALRTQTKPNEVTFEKSPGGEGWLMVSCFCRGTPIGKVFFADTPEARNEWQRAAREAFEEAGEEAREAADMNTYFTKKYGEDWWLQFGSDIASAYEEWDELKERKAEEDDYDYY